MSNGIWDRLRGARRIEVFIALTLTAALALIAVNALGGDEGSTEKTALEHRLERALEQIDGAGQVTAMVTENEEGNVEGVLVVADGLEDLGTYLCLQRAVIALLEVVPSRVEIIGRSGRFGGAG